MFVKGPAGVDVTADIASQLEVPVAEALHASKARIFRRDDVRVGIAVAAFLFPRLSIVVDREFFSFEPAARSFVIAHEVAHFKNRDPVSVLLGPYVLAYAIGMTAVQISIHIDVALGLVILACGLGLLGFAIVYFAGFIERRADLYAAKLVGLEPALEALQELRASRTVRIAGANVLTKLESRIAALEKAKKKER